MQQNKDGVQRLFKRFGHFNLVVLLLGTTLCAQSFQDFKRTQAKSFQKFQDERDAAFNNYLKESWKEYKAQDALNLYEKAKPKNTLKIPEKQISQVGPKIHLKLIKIQEKEPKKETNIAQKDINFEFFGSGLGFNIDKNFKEARYFPHNQEGISNYFSSLAKSEYQVTLLELEEIQKNLQLNDWGMYLLVKDLAKEISSNEDEEKLFTWFILNKLGYDVKVGLSGMRVILMHYSKKVIYATPSYTFSKKKFYVLSHYAKGKVGRLYTYNQSYPGATKALDLSLPKLPTLEQNFKKKKLSFKQFGKEYKTEFSYNQNLIDFMSTYPQADYETFFNAPMEEKTYYAIATDIKKYIDGKHTSEGINFILNFVQKAFVYEIDDLQFGREKVMFAEETLYYNKSDCEDRAILFSYLVKELFGVTIVGVKYSDHMATALYIPLKGDSVIKGKKRYVIADPSYINANLGQSMPKYKSIIPDQFIIVKK